jgi:hypothetical protein
MAAPITTSRKNPQSANIATRNFTVVKYSGQSIIAARTLGKEEGRSQKGKKPPRLPDSASLNHRVRDQAPSSATRLKGKFSNQHPENPLLPLLPSVQIFFVFFCNASIPGFSAP